MDYDLLYPGRFLKSGEFGGQDRTFTIVGVRVEELELDKGGVRGKGIISFADEKKEWVLNRTNGECLKAMWGRETGAWIDKRVTLFPAPFFDPFVRAQGTAIRVRGSPDLSAPLSVAIRLRKKRETTMTLTRTVGAAVPAPAAVVSTPAPAAVVSTPAPAAVVSTPAPAAVGVPRNDDRGIRSAIKFLLERHGLRGAQAVAFVERVTGRTTNHDAADLARIDVALVGEYPIQAQKHGP